MKANSTSLLDFLSKSMKLRVPRYQRPYSWDEEQCEQLWNDIMRVGGASEEIDHFTGCIVLMPTGAAQPTAFEEFLIIDGQQRLTTVTLLLIALERLGDKKIEGLNPRRYIQNQGREGSQEYKLELSNEDKYTPRNLLNGANPKKGTKLETNFGFFEENLKKGDLEKVCKGLARLNVVSIILDSKRDDPQLVFESMNATGKGLSQADLIRNYALMGLELYTQKRLYKDYWREMEESFQRNFEQKYSDHLNDFVKHFLIMKTKKEKQEKKIYEAFKSYHRDTCEDIEEILREMKKYSEFYNLISLGREKDPALNEAFKELTSDKGLNVKTPYPLLLKLYDQYYGGNLEKSEFEKIVRLIISYVFRRAICSIGAVRQEVFIGFLEHFYDEVSFGSFEAHLAKLKDGSRRDKNRFPDDEEFLGCLKSKEIYSTSGGFRQKCCKYLLVKLENKSRKPEMNKEGETINPGDYKIEHIMPQTLEAEWERELGEHYAKVHKKYQHTLGNLTLTGNNSTLGNKPFKQKRDMKGGFAESPLRINRELAKFDSWSGEEIEERAKGLAEEAVKIWAAPRGEGKESKQAYDLDSLFEGRNSRGLYDAFHGEIDKLGLKRQVGRTVISYWQKTKVLAVNLNDDSIRVEIEFREGRESVKDPENRLSFPPSKSHAGITIKSPDDIPYLMDLINQALEQDL